MDTFNVTVGPKTSAHPSYGQGSDLGFLINGSPARGPLRMMRGQQYTFNVTTPGHPFYLTTDSVGLGKGQLTNPVEMGRVTYRPDDQTPGLIYYQCAKHPSMGGPIRVSSPLGKIAMILLGLLLFALFLWWPGLALLLVIVGLIYLFLR